MTDQDPGFRLIGNNKPIIDALAHAEILGSEEIARRAAADKARTDLKAFQSQLAAIGGTVHSEVLKAVQDHHPIGSRTDPILTRLGRMAREKIQKGNTSNSWPEKTDRFTYAFSAAYHVDKTGTVDDLRTFTADVSSNNPNQPSKVAIGLAFSQGSLTELTYTKTHIPAEIHEDLNCEDPDLMNYLVFVERRPRLRALYNNFPPYFYQHFFRDISAHGQLRFNLAGVPSIAVQSGLECEEDNAISSLGGSGKKDEIDKQKASMTVNLSFKSEVNNLLPDSWENRSSENIFYKTAEKLSISPKTYIGLISECLGVITER